MAAAAVVTIASTQVAHAEQAEPRVGALRRGAQLELGLGAVVGHGAGGTPVGVGWRIGLRMDRPGRFYGKLGFRINKHTAEWPEPSMARGAVDIGVGLRTRRRAGVTAFAAVGLQVGVVVATPGLLDVPFDPNVPNDVEQVPALAPELSAGLQWWRTRVVAFGVAGSYAPFWVDGSAVHAIEAQLTVGVAL